MNAVSRLFAGRTSERVRQELVCLPQPQRYSVMLEEASTRRAGLAGLSGTELEQARAAVAQLEAAAAEYRRKHDRTFVQADTLTQELVAVQRREREDIITNRMRFHDGPESEDCARRMREAADAAAELLAQRIATHLLAKAWGIEVPWSLGFPPAAAEKRAKEILAELSGGAEP